MSLLREIQDATCNQEIKLSNLLRKCKILAARLEHEPFKSWVNSELNGYPSNNNLPTYRILRNIELYGDFYNSYGSGIANAHIPSLNIAKEYREDLTTIYFGNSISGLESLIERATDLSIRFTWPANTLTLIRPRVYFYLECVTAWRVVSVNSLVAILDTVKNRVLDFALEIEAQAPEAGEAEIGVQPLPEPVVTQIFYQYILQENNYSVSGNDAIITTLNKEIIMSEDRSTNIQAGNNVSGTTGGSDISGVVAGGEISGIVTNTSSQNNGSDINEVLKLTEFLRQQIADISPENQDVAVDSLETLDAEVITPTKPAKIKSALFALWSVSKDIASVSNTVLAIADKLGIHLHR